MSDLRSRLRGSLYGLAVGDALGAPYEFKGRRAYKVSGNMEDSYIFKHDGKPLKAGTWTDDTSLSLCLAESLNDNDGLNWQDVAKKMLNWYRKGYLSAIGDCFDIGDGTRRALETYNNALANGHGLSSPVGSAESIYSGNGSLMRLAPIPVLYHTDPATAVQNSDLQSKITHGSVLCLESCRLATVQIIGFLTDTSASSFEERKKRVLSPEYLPSGLTESDLSLTINEVKALRAGDYKVKTADGIHTSGFVIHSHEAALWALWNSSSFEEGMLLLLPLGSDVDTVCAIYGQIAGALYGFDNIPTRWLDSLQRQDILKSVFDTLVDKALNRQATS